MPTYTEKQRVALVAAFLIQVLTAHTWQAAFAAVQKHDDLKGSFTNEDMTKTQKQEARRLGKKFLKAGTVENMPRTKKVNTHVLLSAITPDEAKLASFLLKSGYVERTATGHGRYREEHNYFESLTGAMERSPQLKSIYDKYAAMCKNVTPQSFMQALYKYDPLLCVRRIHMKYALDKELRAQRKTKATSFLTRAKREPDFLERLFFVDECAINFDHEIRKGVHVYCDAHDKGYRYVIPVKKLSANKGIKVKVMGAVNMVTGAVFLEFTSGTTDINRMHNKPGGNPQHQYLVSMQRNCLLPGYYNNAPWQRHHLSTWQPAHQDLYVRLHAACLVGKYCSVPPTQHNTQGAGSIQAGT